MSKICTALVPLQSFSSFKSYSNFNFKIAQKWEILRENNVIFQFLENLNIYLPMSYLSFFQLFNDFFLKNGAKFDTFSLIFEIQPPLLIRFSDAEIPIVWLEQKRHKKMLSIRKFCRVAWMGLKMNLNDLHTFTRD